MKKHLNYLSFIVVLLAISLSFKSQLPLTITKADAPKTEFSTERALIHLKEISKAPHYVGVNDHTRVRNYIKKELEKLGLQVEIQEQVIISKKRGVGVNSKNILARIKGKNSTKALLLLSHYDSAVHSSFGASDDGSGVVTIIEGIRAFLAQNTQTENDIIILISDAEEIGLLGASAFVENHPWAKDVGLVINFEARGSGGSSYMLIETNGGNKQMIKEFAKANPSFPVGNSLMYSIYKMLPNDMNATIFREDADIEGYNFAFMDDHFDYHMASDNTENLDIRTLEHQGNYIMAMLNHFSNADLSKLKSDTDYVYFNFPVLGMVYYPFSWIFPMLVIAILAFIVLIVLGLKNAKLSAKAMFIGFIPFLIILIVVPLITFFAWKAILLIHPQYHDILHGFTYNGYYYLAAFSSLTLGFAFLIYHIFLRKQKVENLMIAPLFFWIIISLLSALHLKGAAFFILPVYFGLTIFAILIYSNSRNTKIISATLLSIPVVVLFSPLVQMFTVGLGLIMLAVSAVFIVLIFSMIIPVVSFFKNNKLASDIFLISGVVFLVIATLKSNYTVERKKPNSLMYVLEQDRSRAFWVSYDKDPDGWTKAYLGDNPAPGNFDTSMVQGRYFNKLNLYKATEIKDIPAAKIDVITDTIIGEERNIKMIIKPQRRVNRIQLLAKNDINFNKIMVNRQLIKPAPDNTSLFIKNASNIITYFLLENENLELDFWIPVNEHPEIKMYETSHDLLSNKLLNLQQRPEEMTSKPFYINDAVVLINTIKF